MIKLQDGTPRSEILDRVPPSDDRAEMVLLGCVLIDPRCLDDISHLRPEDFYAPQHSELFRVTKAMHDAGKKLDVYIIQSELKRLGRLEAIGGVSYLAEILKLAPNAWHAAYHAQSVKSFSVRRQLIDASSETLRDAWDSTDEVKSIIDRAEARVYAVQDGRDDNQAVEFKSAIRDAMDRIEQRLDHGIVEGVVSTGFANVDAHVGGFHESELTILAARTSMGKTALALNFMLRVAKAGRLVAFFSLEMSDDELTERSLVAESRVNSHRLRNGTLDRDDRPSLVEAAASLSSLPIHFDASPSQSVSKIASQLRRISRKATAPLGLVVVDYLQLVDPDDHKSPRQEQVAKISRKLKTMAKEFSVPVLCLSQLNRQLENSSDPRPKLFHLRESGAIEQDADNVWFIHRPEVYARDDNARRECAGEAELLIAKQRNGPRDVVAKLVFIKESMRFEDAAPKRIAVLDDFNNQSEDSYYSEF